VPRLVSRRIEIESKYDRMDTMEADSLDEIGSRAGLSCPECGGPLWRMQDGSFLRYRCHVGHAYTAECMAAEQTQTEETYLWQALRLMKERIALLRDIEEAARTRGDSGSHSAAISQLERNIKGIQRMIEDARPAAG
jgi:two-component system chemotaxis response regulator CheB